MIKHYPYETPALETLEFVGCFSMLTGSLRPEATTGDIVSDDDLDPNPFGF